LYLLSHSIRRRRTTGTSNFEANARWTRFGGYFFDRGHAQVIATPGSDGMSRHRDMLSCVSYIPSMEKASDIGKPTVPIDLIGPEHWTRSKRGTGRATQVIFVIVGGLAAAGAIAYRVFGIGR